MRSRIRVIAAGALLLLAAVGCGGDDDDGESPEARESGRVVITIDARRERTGDVGTFTLTGGAINESGSETSRFVSGGEGERRTLRRVLRGREGSITLLLTTTAQTEESARYRWRVTGGSDDYANARGNGTGRDEYLTGNRIRGRFTGTISGVG